MKAQASKFIVGILIAVVVLVGILVWWGTTFGPLPPIFPNQTAQARIQNYRASCQSWKEGGCTGDQPPTQTIAGETYCCNCTDADHSFGIHC